MARIFNIIEVSHTIYGLVTFIPLFSSVIILVFFPETLQTKKPNIIDFDTFCQIESLKALTARELEVCYHMLNGSSNQAISNILCISESTVKTHISRIYSKLYVKSRAELKKHVELELSISY